MGGGGLLNANNGKYQISFRVPTEMAEELKAASVEEGFHKVAPFCRDLLAWAWTKHKKAGALILLKRSELKVPPIRAKE
jgi:hypothetical protein